MSTRSICVRNYSKNQNMRCWVLWTRNFLYTRTGRESESLANLRGLQSEGRVELKVFLISQGDETLPKRARVESVGAPWQFHPSWCRWVCCSFSCLNFQFIYYSMFAIFSHFTEFHIFCVMMMLKLAKGKKVLVFCSYCHHDKWNEMIIVKKHARIV